MTVVIQPDVCRNTLVEGSKKKSILSLNEFSSEVRIIDKNKRSVIKIFREYSEQSQKSSFQQPLKVITAGTRTKPCIKNDALRE